MARPVKDGLDYFQLDVQLSTKYKMLVAKYGNEALGIWLRLAQHIYGSKGYYMPYNEDELLVLSAEFNITYDKLDELILFMVSKNIFDKEMFKEHQILTSEKFQNNFVNAIKRRKKPLDEYDYLTLIDDTNGVNVNIMQHNANITQHNADKSKQNGNKIQHNDEKPTQKQIDFAKSLNISAPESYSKFELAKMIDIKKDETYTAPDWESEKTETPMFTADQLEELL